MVQQHQQELKKQIWNIANSLRGNMSADDFRDYILGDIDLSSILFKPHSEQV
ncbi:type I restriction-modification system subunit M N-terminal domain-containing protein [Pseudoalteromonas aliena]|uniref:type I restriction-modification system subunit M N-terminal domain-containing protein n=1 Tax=Pseudoalteromonas aliena TaxID=247523 RepID=UPI0024952D2B|nr:type I restriction-modification system subunit M N-terminal domain-containing protein [Pseudoalteromonas aliena]